MDPGDSPFLFTTSLTNTRYSTFAALSFLLYDYLLTFDVEKRLVWNNPWSFGKILFIFNRYFGSLALTFNSVMLLTSLPNDSQLCKGFRMWEGLAVMIAVMSTEVILMTRIYAVYDRNKLILFVMAVLFAANIASTALIIYVGPPGGALSLSVYISGCHVVDRGFSYFLCWLPAFGFETTLVTIMLYRGLRTRERGLNSPLLNVVIRDSIIYFLVIFTALFVNCLIWGMSPQTFNVELSGCWTIAASCAFGSRLLLNIRERYYKEQSFIAVETKPLFKRETTSV